MSDLLSFTFENADVRIVMRSGDPWFIATDAAATLGYRDASNAVRGLDDDEKGTHNLSTLGGIQTVAIISESGLYHLIFTSRKDVAKRFRRWVTSDVLPSIRKTGRYDPEKGVHTVDTLPSRRPVFEGSLSSPADFGRACLAHLFRTPHWGTMHLTGGGLACTDPTLPELMLPTIGEAIGQACAGDSKRGGELALNGLTVTKQRGGGLWIARRSPFLVQVFRDTPWDAGGWRRALRALPGADIEHRTSGRAIFVPGLFLITRPDGKGSGNSRPLRMANGRELPDHSSPLDLTPGAGA